MPGRLACRAAPRLSPKAPHLPNVDDLYRQGEVVVLGGPSSDVPLVLIRPGEQVLLGRDGRAAEPQSSTSCFGQEALLGRRREDTVSAHTQCELLVIDREALEIVFRHDVISAQRICTAVVRGFRERDMRRRFVLAHRIRLAYKRERHLCAALTLQLAWMNYSDKVAQEHDPLYKHVLQAPQNRMRARRSHDLRGALSTAPSKASSTPERPPGAVASTPPTDVTAAAVVRMEDAVLSSALQTVLEDMREQLANVSKVQSDLHTSQLHLTAQVAGMDAKLSMFIASAEERARNAPPTPYLVI